MPEMSNADKFKAVTAEMLNLQEELHGLVDEFGVLTRNMYIKGVDDCLQHDIVGIIETINMGLAIEAQLIALLSGYHAEAVHQDDLPPKIMMYLRAQTQSLEEWFAKIVEQRKAKERRKAAGHPEPEVRGEVGLPSAEGWLERIFRATKR